MNTTKDIKINFSTLIQRMWKNEQNGSQTDKPFFLIEEIISFIIKLYKIKKFYDLKNNKFCFLELSNVDFKDEIITIITGMFKSARNEFRPNLINKKNGNERKNPKEITEGDIEKTHFVIKLDKNTNEVYLFLEYNFHGINTNDVVNYLQYFTNQYLASINMPRNFSVKHLIIPRNNFLTELEKLARTKLAEVYFDRQLLGSKALNFSNRFISLKKDIKLTATASSHKESITDVVIDLFNAFNNGKNDITKVRVYGNDLDDNEVVLDTSFMSKVEFLNIDINPETGELNTTQIFSGLKKIANSF